MKTVITILSLTIATLVTSAQSVAFRVLAVKGKVEVKTHGVWSSLKPGSKIPQHCDVRLSGNSYVGLIHVSGKPLELLKPGVYTYKDMHKFVSTEKSPIEKYTTFLLAKSEQSKNRLAATGAVHRGGQDITILLPEETVNVLNTDLILIWKSNKSNVPYTVTFSDMFGNEILRKEASEEQISLSLDTGTLSQYSVFSVKVTSLADPSLESGEHYVKRLSGDNRRALLDEHEVLKQSFGEGSTPLTVMLESAFFEEKNLPIEAITAIKRFISNNESGEVLTEALNELLTRYGLGEGE